MAGPQTQMSISPIWRPSARSQMSIIPIWRGPSAQNHQLSQFGGFDSKCCDFPKSNVKVTGTGVDNNDEIEVWKNITILVFVPIITTCNMKKFEETFCPPIKSASS